MKDMEAVPTASNAANNTRFIDLDIESVLIVLGLCGLLHKFENKDTEVKVLHIFVQDHII